MPPDEADFGYGTPDKRPRDDFAARDSAQAQVRADALVSCNGRPAARTINPTVNLATIRPGVGPVSWVMPEP